MKNNKNIATLGLLSLLILNVLVFKIVLDKTIDLVEVPLASEQINPRTKIDEKLIEIKKIPRLYLNENAYIEKKDILDKYTDIEGKIPKGSLFYKNMLFEEKELPDYPALKLKEGQNVFSLSTDLIKSSGNTLVPNQKVDLYVTIEQKKEKPVTDLLFSSVRILDVLDRKGNRMDSEKASGVPYVINLAISADYIEILKLASKVGSIDLYATTFPQEDECLFNEENRIMPFLKDEEADE